MSIFVILILEIIGAIAMFLAWGWLAPVLMVVYALALYRYTRATGRTVGEGIALVLYSIAVAERWPDYGLTYAIVALIAFIFFVRALMREARGY